MKALRTLTTAMLVTAVIGCSDTAAPSDPADLAGTWNATSMVFVDDADPTVSVDVVTMGASFQLVIAADGTFTGAFAMGSEIEPFAGTIAISGTNLIITDSLDPTDTSTVAFTLDGNTLTLMDDEELYDFDDDGQEEPANSTWVMEKQ
jgi:hypothetical protein